MMGILLIYITEKEDKEVKWMAKWNDKKQKRQNLMIMSLFIRLGSNSLAFFTLWFFTVITLSGDIEAQIQFVKDTDFENLHWMIY